MAYCPQGILGPFSKRVGPVVGCICRNRSNYVRTYPLSFNDAKTPGQLLNRAKMREVMGFVSKAKEFVKFTFGRMTQNQTECNIATKINFHKVKIVGGGESEGEREVRVRLEYDQLRLSHGEMMGLDSALLLRSEAGLELRWKSLINTEYSDGTDKVHVFVYNETRNAGWMKQNMANRREEECEMALPEKWLEDRLHVYVVVTDAKERRFGDTQYFGVGGENGKMKRGEMVGALTAMDADEAINLVKKSRFEGCRTSDSRRNSFSFVAEQVALRMLFGLGLERDGERTEKGKELECGDPKGEILSPPE